MWNRFSLTILISFGISAAYAGPIVFDYDGKFVASEYDRVFGLNYEYDGRIISGGTIALATVGTTQYLYISHPLGYKDFSYGSDANEIYRVGWDGQDDGNISLSKAVDSEFFGLDLTTGAHSATSDDVTHSLKFDLKRPNQDSKINGTGVNAGESVTSGSGGSMAIVSFISTLDYNAKQLSGSYDGSLGIFEDHSPETLTAGCADETSSDSLCYLLKDNTLDWIFDFGIEIELKRQDGELFFGDLDNIDLSMFGYQNGGVPISLNDLHASDPKTVSSYKHDPLDCPSGGTSSRHEVCSASVISVPEPSTFAILGLGLLGLGFSRRKRLQ